MLKECERSARAQFKTNACQHLCFIPVERLLGPRFHSKVSEVTRRPESEGGGGGGVKEASQVCKAEKESEQMPLGDCNGFPRVLLHPLPWSIDSTTIWTEFNGCEGGGCISRQANQSYSSSVRAVCCFAPEGHFALLLCLSRAEQTDLHYQVSAGR